MMLGVEGTFCRHTLDAQQERLPDGVSLRNRHLTCERAQLSRKSLRISGVPCPLNLARFHRNLIARDRKSAIIAISPMIDRIHTVSSRNHAETRSSGMRYNAISRLFALAFAAFMISSVEAFSQVYISEFLADNQVNSVVDEDFDHSDWLEIWNSGAAPVSLNGWYLTDDSGDLRQWQFPLATPSVTVAAGGRLLIYASGKNRKLLANRLHTSFKLSKSAGSYLALVRPDGLTVEHAYANYPQQVQDIAYGLPPQTAFQTLVAPGAPGKAKVPLSAADMPAGWNGNAAFDDSTWQAGATGFGYDTAGTINYGDLIGAGGDLQTAMHNVNSTALIRIPFTVSNLAQIISLKLSMKYDDGYVCYLNGTLIASQLAPASPTWNSAATVDRTDAITNTYEVVTPANAQAALVNGQNTLAIQLLNNSNGTTQDVDGNGVPNGSRTLCLPLLEANVNVGFGAPAYLQPATPNAANGGPIGALGPLISGTTNSAARPVGGAGSAPILITTKVVPSLRPLATTNPVLLRYRIAYGGEQTINMRDDGTAPDTIAGDGIYAAELPTTALAPGAMIRWRVSASDNNTTPAVSTEPPFRDTTDNDQFYGTVAQDSAAQGIANSNLPILYWFVQDAASSRTAQPGTRCSLYYLGKFYDNVFVNLHGQSSSGFPVDKKSHNFNFNEDNRFIWKEGQPAQRAVNLLTNYADKAKVRNTVAWESWANASHIASHYSFPVRVQQNGVFWGIYDMVENGDEDFLQRCGLDVNGALYKIYNSLESTTNAEKKTRELEGTTDLQALISGLDTGTQSLINRRRFSYDNVDVPSLVNYLANNIIVLNNDFGHKNYYVYRDTNGTREWSVLPWDQDLSLGHTWTSSQAYFNDDIHTMKSNVATSELVLGAAGGNRLLNLVTNTSTGTVAPEMARMFLARLRTLMQKNFVSATETNGPLEQRINQLIDLMDPPGTPVATLTDADRDLQRWGYWTDGNGSQLSGNGQDAAVHDHGVRKQALRILSANPTPPYPSSANNAEGLFDTRPAYLPGRRTRLFNGGLTMLGFPIPPAPSTNPTGIVFEAVEFNPGNQDQEYFIIRNNTANYVDISDWKVTGAVEYAFRGGTVLPPFTSNQPITATGDVHIGRIHVARNPFAFRSRTVSPKGNEFRLVVGGYKGQLSARGETINLVKPGATPEQDVIIATTTYTGAPTRTQDFLRISELNYNPTDPTPDELAALPGVEASDFEFIELINTDSAPLDLGGATFDKGVTFTFPAGFTLQPGQRCVVASLLAAYNLRYNAAGAIVAGQFEGNLSNGGEDLQILDASGEVILDFKYDPEWYGVPNPAAGDGISPVKGYSLVTRTAAPAFNSYQNPTTWALGGTANGTPGQSDSSFNAVYLGWTHDHFTPAEETSGLSVPNGDADTDGRSNFAEYSFVNNPRSADTGSILARAAVTVGELTYPAVRFNARASALDIAWLVEASNDGGNVWRPLDSSLMTKVSIDADTDQLTYRDSLAALEGDRIFRVRAQYVGTNYFTEALTIQNRVPIVGPDSARTTTAPVTIAVLANDSDPDDDPITISRLGVPLRGSVVLNPDNSITFTPDGTFPGAGGGIVYFVRDNFGGETQAIVPIASNAVPVAVADIANVHGATATINVLTNDTDMDNDTLEITGVTQGAHGDVAIVGGSVTYAPKASFSNATGDSFQYTIADGFGGTATGNVTITKTNTSPVAANDTVAVHPGTVAVLALVNDTDAENDSLTITDVTQGNHGTVTFDAGSISYTAGGSFNTSDSFTYTISDGFGGTNTGTVNITNAAPQAADDRQRVADSTTPVLIEVIANDQEPDNGQALSITSTTQPSSGSVAVEGGTKIRYTPSSSFAATGTDTFTYTVSDGFGGTSTATVDVVNELVASETGSYLGLVGGDGEPSVGLAQIKLSKKGAYTGTIWYRGDRFAVKQKFAGIGNSNFSVTPKGGTARQIALQLDSGEDGMTGELTDGGTTYQVKLKRVVKVFTKTNPCPQAGAYTALLPPDSTDEGYPQGYGSATMTVSSTGALKAIATLGDGKRVILKAAVDGEKTALLHAPLYVKPKGFICGKIEFITNDPDADSRGTLTWVKPQQLKADATYSSGFDGSTDWIAARYTKPAKGVPIFGASVTSATVTLEDGGLDPSPIQKTATITAKGISITPSGSDTLTITVNPATGAFTGKYAHPKDLKKRTLSGVLYQKQSAARGFFNGVNASGQGVTGSWMLAP